MQAPTLWNHAILLNVLKMGNGREGRSKRLQGSQEQNVKFHLVLLMQSLHYNTVHSKAILYFCGNTALKRDTP